MGNFQKIFKTSLPDLATFSPKAQEKITSSVAFAMPDYDDDCVADLKDIVAQLAAHKIKPGKYVDNGNLSFIFELDTIDGKHVPSAVVRIEAITTRDASGGMGKDSDSPAALQSLLTLENGQYRASIVPRAVDKSEVKMDMDDVLRTFAIFNAEDKLKYVTDMGLSQIMALRRPDGDLVRYRDGTPAGIMVDLTSARPKVGHEGQVSLGILDSFFTVHNLNKAEIMERRAPMEEVEHIRAQINEITHHVRRDLERAGIKLDAVPTVQENVQLEQAGHAKQRQI